MAQKIIILGGAGSMGKIIVRDLLEFAPADLSLVVADFDLNRARQVVESYQSKRSMESVQVQVQDVRSMISLFSTDCIVINSSPYQYNVHVMQACLEAGCHYIDLGGLFHVTRKQLDLHEEFKRQNILALIGMGAAPGITNVLSRILCDKLDKVLEIHTRDVGIDKSRYSFLPALPVSYSLLTILEEFSMEPAVFTKGEFKFVEPMSGATKQKFPAPIGVSYPMYTLHSEVATLPLSYKHKGVREVSFKIAFDEDFLTKVRFLRDMGFASHTPINVNGAMVEPVMVANRVAMAQKPAVRKGPPNQAECIRAVVKGFQKKKKVTLVADCMTRGMPAWGVGTDINTGTPPSIAAMMILRGEITERGVLPAEIAVPPEPFLKELKKRKMTVTYSRTSGWEFPT